jgi:hypothetical protein
MGETSMLRFLALLLSDKAILHPAAASRRNIPGVE